MPATQNASRSIRLLGQGSFPGVVGSLTVTWPLAVVVADTDGISMRVRFRPMRRVLRHVPGTGKLSLGVDAAWEQVGSIEVARRSIVLKVRDGGTCRFQPLRRRSLVPLLDLATAKGVPIKLVGTTVGWYIRPRV
jgi:hypothetical protein